MSSRRKRASARANGAKSCGPTTPEGRLNSALANQRHGLLAKTVCLINEIESVLIEMQQEYTHHFQPVGPVELDLVEATAVAKWQERRIWTIQTATLDLRMDTDMAEIDAKYETLDQPTRLSLAFGAEANKSHSLALQLRYANSHRRAYERSLQLLLKLQAARKSDQSDPNQKLRPNPIPKMNTSPIHPRTKPRTSRICE